MDKPLTRRNGSAVRVEPVQHERDAGHVDERLGRGHGRLVVVAEPVVRQSHSVRAVCDEQVRTEISRVHSENYGVYGIRKVHAQLGREGAVCTADPSPAAPWRG